MSNRKRIGKGRNAFSVLESDFKSGFKNDKIEVWHGKDKTLQDAHNIRKEVARIEGIREIKPKVKKGKK